ncbi:hypothetical protein K458DRAFT_389486 [Lentithecium fluviatile CBS 122367]|uniref:Uncharacterized protein n=1 Tax=Lentithecium fluviatile CBS 122367 TaxID=1168545 RepID=A0A6G1J048_9PLEO|nr:hypothetical protein K458DRAFT_389486 [Lentithecium fluviatile CBS 122367]
MKGNDFGKAIGIDRPANVRDKIKKWQQELDADAGAGAENATSSAPESDSKLAPSPKPPSTPKARPLEEKPSPKPAITPKSVEAPMSAKKPPVHNKLDEEVHVATAPKKRVISDSHWRNKSPQKDGNKRTSPKPLPTAWVRPAARKADSSEPKVATPPPRPKAPIIFTSKRTGQRTRSQRQRRPSRPTSSGNGERPTSSGSGSGKGAKSAGEGATAPSSPASSGGKTEKTELVRVRRRRAQTSPRGSLSAEDVTPVKTRSVRKSETSLSEDPANLITVEYEPSLVDSRSHDEIRERRRNGRRKVHSDASQESLPKEFASNARRKSHRRSHQQDDQEAVLRSPEPRTATAPATPPQVFGNRLEAWLSTTPDPFVDADSRRRRKSKDSVANSEPALQIGKSQMRDPSDVKDAPVEEVPDRTESRRRRRKRSSTLKVETLDLGDAPSPATPTEPVDNPATEKSQDGTPTPALTLKRRAARRSQHSPVKERIMSLPARELPEMEEEATSSAPSSVDPQSMELEKLSLKPPFESPTMRRLFPSTGKRLSTIVSVETFATKMQQAPPSEASASETVKLEDEQSRALKMPAFEVGTQLETSTIVSRRSTRRSRLASHADLISVLSMPKAGTKSIMSARSIRTNRSRLATATIGDIMDELASDESKYMRELRTLVDGVIPVLLSCVLSKSDSAVAAGLFSRSNKADPAVVTKPIVDMGVSLERLKNLHKRVPKDDSEAFLSWAQSAQRIYSDYIAAWRLGFQDVVISLASADDDPFTPAKVVDGPEDGAPWDEGLSRNAEGYVVNGDGERVDVAYMLKRPLVRLKYLAKSIKGINHTKPSERAEKMSEIFQQLVVTARKRSNDEHARLEDEAASSIDPTRARDPRSLAPLAGVRIDPNRCVRARDHFDLHLYHSSGQEVSCRVEVLLRDDAPGHGTSGDILVCEVDNTGRWLLLPPIQLNRISARNGDNKGEIIVMTRGFHADGNEWSEIFSLTSDDEHAGFEWVQMLGLNPIPPQLSELEREQTLDKPARPTSSHASSSLVSAATGSTPPHKSRTPSPHEIEIPIGEQANATSKKWGYDTPTRLSQSRSVSPITPPSSEHLYLVGSADTAVSPPSPVEALSRIDEDVVTASPRARGNDEEDRTDRTPRSLNDAMQLAGSHSPLSLKRTRAKRLSKNPASPASRPSRQIVLDDPPPEEPLPTKKLSKRRGHQKSHSASPSSMSRSSKGFSVWMPNSEAEDSDESDEDKRSVEADREHAVRPQMHRRTSSVPTLDMPNIPKLRKSSQPTTPVKAEEPSKLPEPPASAPPKLEYAFETPEEVTLPDEDEAPPPVPPHRTPSPATPVTLKSSNTPVFTPTQSVFRQKRRSSSPLKHEYEPSTCTESSSESEEEISEEEEHITSESSDDELEDDVPTPLMPLGQIKPLPKVSPPGSIYTLPNGTITPSQSASNTPYRAVPQTSARASKAIASIFTWSDAGRWDSLYPEECSIVVTPGKIEVFEITATHSRPLMADGDEIIQPGGKAPLIAVELTPLVPLRKSTAIDISIRSPPTAESRIKSGNNIMLRSRNAQECAQLYAMINHSRINNPTYIALQNARGPYGQSSWAEAMDRQNAARSNSGSSNGWFGGTLGRRSSYRKTSTRAASISAATESSVGTMNTAFRSALGRFSFAKNRRFNIRGSTLGSRSSGSFDTGSSGSGASTPSGLVDPERAPGAPAGITNTKCRLYERESLTKWRDMGAARLTIMLPDRSTPASTMREGKGSPGVRDISQEKRIVVIGKNKGETLLDVTLSESCFERVARSGIAVSVWEDLVGADGVVGRAGVTGGVSGARARVFMIQMKSERECAYSFSLLGKLRY